MADWWKDVVAFLGALTPADWLGAVGTLVAAMIGIVGLSFVLTAERRERKVVRFETALTNVMIGLGDQHTAIESWLMETGFQGRIRMHSMEETGGPPDTELQILVDIAYLQVPRGDEDAMGVLAQATYRLKTARVSYQKAQIGRIVGDIRKWRTGAMTRRQFIQIMDQVIEGARRSEESALQESADRQERADREAEARAAKKQQTDGA